MCCSVRKLGAVIVLLILVSVIPACAMLDPSAVYCTESGYAYETVIKSNGNEYGVCRLPNGAYVDSWEFLRGKTGQNFNYCIRMGYSSKTSTDPKMCSAVKDNTCTVCVLPDKREIEVTTLMNLSFAETTCGDGRCVITENFRNCPADCAQSGPDDYCQGIFDFKCDPDCIGGKGDYDCLYTGNPMLIVLAVVVIAGAGLGIWYLVRKRKADKN
jgi:putative hemolysin